MREALVKLFRDKLNVPLYLNMTPENAKYPCGAYAISEDNTETELDGEGITSREVVFDVDVVCNNVNEVDLIRSLLVDLSGKRYHRYTELFQLMMLRSVEDVGPLLGVTTDTENPPQILSLRISLFE